MARGTEEAARSNSSSVLVTGKHGLAAAGAGVGLVAGGDLGLDQGAEELLGVPPLGLGGDQQFGGEPAHGGHLQPFQPGGEVGGQGRRSWRHWLLAADLVGVQRSGRHRRQGEYQGLPGRPRGRCGAARGEDGADVGGPPAAELHGPAQRGQQGFGAVRRVQGGDVGQLGRQLRHPGRGGPDQERLRDRSEGQEVLLRLGSGPGCPARPVRPWTAVVVVDDAGLTRRDQPVLGQHFPGDRLDHGDHRRRGGDGDLVADQPARHRVAGRAEPDTRQPVDLPGDRPGAQLEPQRRQRAEQRLLDGQPLGREPHRSPNGGRVDLGAPDGCRRVGRSRSSKGCCGTIRSRLA